MGKRYEMIADKIRGDIGAGTYRQGERLPSESVLAAEHHVSLPTLRQALALLEAEGTIEKKHGLGNFVRRPRRRAERSNLRHQWEKDRARLPRHERETTGATEFDTGLPVDELEFHATYREVPATEDLAPVLGVPVDTPLLQRTYRTRSRSEDEPFNVSYSYLVKDLVAANPTLLDETNEPWPGGTQSQLASIGIELDRIEERLIARPPTSTEVSDLGLRPGVAVMELRKISIDVQGQVVEVADVVLPGDRYSLVYVTQLERWA